MLDSDLEILNHTDWFLSIFNNISDLVFLIKVDEHSDFRYVFMNELAKKYSGLTEEAIGKTIHEAMPKHAADLIVQKYKNSIEKKESITYEDYTIDPCKAFEDFEYASCNPNDLEYFETKVTPIFNKNEICTHIIAIVRDISDRIKRERALKESEEKYRLIAENMKDLVSIMDLKGIVRYASPSYQLILGYSPEDYVNQNILDYIHPDDVQAIQSQGLNLFTTKKQMMMEFRHRHANGSWIWIEVKISPVLDDLKNTVHFLVVSREIMERKAFEEKLQYMAFHDPLTGLPNRRFFKKKLTEYLSESEKSGQKIAAMFMDIDKFKQVNDTFGHDIGDELLYQFSQRVQACLRKSDMLARFGGDEFCALLFIHKENDAIIIAKKIINALQGNWKVQTHAFTATTSIGIAFYETSMDHESLIKRADIALYRAKENGRNNYQIYK